MSVPGFEHLPGTRLPDGVFSVSREDDRRLTALLEGEPAPDGAPHPVWLFVALLSGLGVTIEELFALGGCAMEDGPMLGGCELDFARPLEPDVRYRVTGTIIGIERKHGRSGTFDVMRAEAALADDAGPVGTCACDYVLPRRAA